MWSKFQVLLETKIWGFFQSAFFVSSLVSAMTVISCVVILPHHLLSCWPLSLTLVVAFVPGAELTKRPQVPGWPQTRTAAASFLASSSFGIKSDSPSAPRSGGCEESVIDLWKNTASKNHVGDSNSREDGFFRLFAPYFECQAIVRSLHFVF